MTHAKHENNNQVALEALSRMFAGDEVGDVCVEGVDELVESTRESATVKRAYNQLAKVDRELSGEAVDSPFERAFGEASFMAALDAQLAEEKPQEDSAPVDNVIQFPGAKWTQVALAAAVLIAAGVGYVVMSEGPTDEFQARSAHVPPVQKYENPRLQAFCVERTEDGPQFRGSESEDFAVLNCANDNELKLAYSNRDARLQYASFFGISVETGTLYWYGPSPAEPSAKQVVVNETWSAVGETVRLSVNHKPGAVRIVGVFTEKPVEFEDLRSWAKGQASQMNRRGEFELRWNGVMTSVEMEITVEGTK